MPGFRPIRKQRPERDERGFTVLELTIAMGLAAFVFAALAGVLLSGLRTLSVAKARTQGNEVATEAIEDLQRFGYAELGFCTAPVAPAPAGLDDPVLLTGGCSSPVYETSCGNTNGTAIDDAYTCTRNGIVYNVQRYIAWADPGQTSKRLAVFVDWHDNVGKHVVSQQSSVRAPGLANVIGLSAPVLTNPMVTPGTVSVENGELLQELSLQVSASGLVSTDRVWAEFRTLDADGVPEANSIFLTSTSGTLWSGTIVAGKQFRWGTGSQFLSFHGLREKDGKQTAIVTSSVTKFCTPTDSSCSASALPAFESTSAPNTIALEPSGALKADIPVKAVTRNVTAAGQVSVAFLTQSGLRSVFLQVDTTAPCTTSSCTWTGTISKAAGHGFNAGDRPVWFTTFQAYNPDPESADKGSTAAHAHTGVKWG